MITTPSTPSIVLTQVSIRSGLSFWSASTKKRYSPFAILAPKFFATDLSPSWDTTSAPIRCAISLVKSVLTQSTTMISIGLCDCEIIDTKQSVIVHSEFFEGIITDTNGELQCPSEPRIFRIFLRSYEGASSSRS